MIREDILKLALESEFGYCEEYIGNKSSPCRKEIVRFAELLEAKVRKECAELCRAEANGRSPLAFDALHECADLMMKGYEE
jgi:hypothetical protein